jgi:hypothetical protein
MALKINTEIGTNKGITNEGYIRIERYNINKHVGSLTVDVGLYQNQSVAESASIIVYPPPHIHFAASLPNNSYLSQNVNVNTTYTFPLTSSVQLSGSYIDVIDLSILESQSVFEFAYPKLKSELESVFGNGNIQDV